MITLLLFSKTLKDSWWGNEVFRDTLILHQALLQSNVHLSLLAFLLHYFLVKLDFLTREQTFLAVLFPAFILVALLARDFF